MMMRRAAIVSAIVLALGFGQANARGAEAQNTGAPNTGAQKTQEAGGQEAGAWETMPSLGAPSKYRGGFAHYDYVNPQAPKGGALNKIIVGSFNSLNPYIVEGQPPAGLMPFGGGFLYNSLMDQSLEEDGVSYPAIAEALRFPPDDSWVIYRLNPAAKWHDGQPITADDVIWSFNTLKKISPFYSAYYAEVAKAEQTGAHEVKFSFTTKGNRELPKIVGDLTVLPRHWWEGTDKTGKKRDITKPTLEIPLGSGAYKIARFSPGKSITWQRAPQAWDASLPQNIGRNNYDSITYNYVLEPNAEWEAFKKGGLSDYRAEHTIARWETGYTFAAFTKGAVKKAVFPYYSGDYQGYYFNTRRAKFADIRVRKALTLAMDFESLNKAIFFNKYQRSMSYYGAQSVGQQGAPQGQTLRLLQDMRAKYPDFVPEEALSAPFTLPVYKSAADTRKYLGEALALLRQAGWQLRDNRLSDKNGQQFSLEILLANAELERPVSFYLAGLRRLGINATMRVVDTAQYAGRTNNFDFDMIMGNTLQSSSPGNEQMEYFASSRAERPGGRNYAGIKNPAADALIEHLIHAQTRDEVVAAARALDTVLLWNYYSVPCWRNASLFLAYWDKFGRPKTQPEHVAVDIYSWWVDPAKQAALQAAGYGSTGGL